MQISMGILKNEHGVYLVRRKVPKELQGAVAKVLANGKPQQTFLQESLRTKEREVAKRKAPAVLMRFDGVLARARALAEEKPLRTTLGQAEIYRMADYFLAEMLRGDEQMRVEGFDAEGLAETLIEVAGVPADRVSEVMISDPHGTRPKFGLSDRELEKLTAVGKWVLPRAERALAKGDLVEVQYAMHDVLATFGINLDQNSSAYRQLGLALLKQLVNGLRSIEQRSVGKWIDTPQLPSVSTAAPIGGETLRAEFTGWKKARSPAPFDFYGSD